MKQIVLFTLIFSTSLFQCYAQSSKEISSEKNQSNAEIFSSRSGTLIQKEFEDIGTIKKCKIQVAKYQDLINGLKSNAVRFEYEYHSTYTSDTKIATLDPDEIDGLIKSLKLIGEKIFPTNPVNYTEVSFKSRSGFAAGCFSGKDKWSTYMKLEQFDTNSYVFMDKEDITQLLTLLEQAKARL
jgi:hypothetical protein